jgi:hypothetical protein
MKAMSNRSFFTLLLPVLAAGFLFSFRSAGKSSRIPAPVLTENRLDSGGRPVSLDSAQRCIDRFEALMKDHGFSDKAGEKVNIHIKRTSMITTGEAFQGKGLLDWLTNTQAQYTAAGKTLMVRIQLGVYDSAYLNTYQTNAKLKKASQDRIAIFLIPYDSAQGPVPVMHAMIAIPGAPPPNGGTGYDLGGIQP